MIMECASDFTYEEWLAKLSEKGMGVGEPPTIEGVIQVGRFFKKFLMGDELKQHFEKFEALVSASGDDSAKEEFISFNSSFLAWSLPSNRLSPMTFARAFSRLHYVERTFPDSAWRLSIALAQYEWFISAFAGPQELKEFSRLATVAAHRSGSSTPSTRAQTTTCALESTAPMTGSGRRSMKSAPLNSHS